MKSSHYLLVGIFLASFDGSQAQVTANTCKFTRAGTAYRGSLSTTKSGKVCQRWDSQSPHQHDTYTADMFPDSTLTEASNKCRNPDGLKPDGPWCHTLDPSLPWEYCDIDFCDCRTTMAGFEYQGTRAVTDQGLQCMQWSSHNPHGHHFNQDSQYPDDTIQDASNYCRNPDKGWMEGPWCYTINPNIRWQNCKNISFCECKTYADGLEYLGWTTTTVSGRTCQQWDSQRPHEHSYTDDSMYPDGSVSKAKNYCRNPDDNEPGGPWCYTTDPTQRWEYCNVPLCEHRLHTTTTVSPPSTTPFTGPAPVAVPVNQIPGTSKQECKFTKMGTSYMGTKSTTVTGKSCQRWDQQTPHQHQYKNPAYFPDRNITLAQNFCRNPDAHIPLGPWCFTTDPNTRWEYCDIPLCECKQSKAGTEYIGQIKTTVSGRACQRWDTQGPHRHHFDQDYFYPDGSMSAAADYCRNPDREEPNGPWCYTMQAATRWEYCNVPFCECRQYEDGLEYRGTVSQTNTGLTCQRWDSQSPHSHGYTDDSMYPDGSMTAANNYCRNPDDNEPNGPWCYTTNPDVRWQYCDVSLCEYHGALPSMPTTTTAVPPPPVEDCKFTVRGTAYIGQKSVTRGGNQCQRWDAQSPHSHSYTSDDMYPDATVSAANNYCRNPDALEDGGPWCYTTNPSVRWEYCDIPICDCRTTLGGHDYRGTRAYSDSGLTCQRWDQQTPHQHHYNQNAQYPDLTISDAQNYCRNPDMGWMEGPWCYTVDPNIRWQPCSIPYCECKETVDGLDYLGHIAVTNTGKTCQRWDAQSPHGHSYTDNSMYPDGSASKADNYCRNPDDNEPGGPWCYTTDPNVRWQYCSVPLCEYHLRTTTTALPPSTTPFTGPTPHAPTATQAPGTTKQECKFTKKGTSYRGTKSTTVTGKTCMSWNSQSPHQHGYNRQEMFPDASVADAQNYCRNPDENEPIGPWCYTTDPTVRWEYCDIPLCDCRQTKAGTEYMGLVRQTVSGRSCQRWDSQAPHRHHYNQDAQYPEGSISAAKDYCRNPDREEPGGPWCYTTDVNVRWEYCDIPYCECKASEDGKQYTGTVAVTQTGQTCQAWSSQSPHSHTTYDPSDFPDSTMVEAANFCRNPEENKPDGPWCYTMNSAIEWQYCDVSPCEYHDPTMPSPTTPTPATPPSPTDCRFTERGTGYIGTTATTRTGKTCQRWDSQSPHNHAYYADDIFPDASVTAANNYCRNPDAEEDGGPWCYTTDPNTRWEYCNIPICDCRTTVGGHEYMGKVSVTNTGISCQRWDRQVPHAHHYNQNQQYPDATISDAENYCRNPDIDWMGGPWCYSINPDIRWQDCDVPFCECKTTPDGLDYLGKKSMTNTGLQCQRWDSQAPHQHQYTDDSMYPDGSATKANNYCRNPDDNEPGGPWCYTTNPSVRWQYCDVPLCEYHIRTTSTVQPPSTTPFTGPTPQAPAVTQAPGTSVQDCKYTKKGTSYRGSKTTTVTGKMCQRWDQQTPHQHHYNRDAQYPDGSISAAGNMCRNPDEDEPLGPWCYTTDPNTRWEYCDIPLCDCRTTKAGTEYMGQVRQTVSGRSCQRWDMQAPHKHHYNQNHTYPDGSVSGAGNNCRNPDREEPGGPWCYTTDASVRWEYCDIPFCECKMNKDGLNYQGTVQVTEENKSCQRWDTQSPHQHSYTDNSLYPGGSITGAANYCRNPDDNEPEGPWCYTTDPNTRWQYCDVILCEFHGAEVSTVPPSAGPTVPATPTDCKYTKRGTSYMGTKSTTVSGRQCQRWDSTSPHQNPYYNKPSAFPDSTVGDAANYCRNPDGEKEQGPWCFTTDASKTWEYCYIPSCDCRTSQAGFEYMGTRSVTDSSKTCQRWDKQTPHAHHYQNPDNYPDGSVSGAQNFCRNPDYGWAAGLWCFTNDPDTRWESCTVDFCECKNDAAGLDFRGKTAVTTSGKPCQRWDSQFPHQHSYTDNSMYPDGSAALANNYCRNPDDNEPNGPWCYTTDPNTRWEYCSIPLCEYKMVTTTTVMPPPTTPFTGPTPAAPVVPQTPGSSRQECKFTKRGTSYRGTKSTTVSGEACQRWDSQSPHGHSYTDPSKYPDGSLSEAQNYCRNPDELEPFGPWCYTTNPNKRWEYCDIPVCDCRQNKAGLEYAGHISQTVSGRTCQRWDSNTPHKHDYLNPDWYPEGSLAEASNYCRNPDRQEPNGPWCYTTDPAVRWEYCDIPYCECKFYEDGLRYQGEIRQTDTGIACQRWDSQSPHQHAYLDNSMFPGGSITGASNYCRNPDDQEPNGPWCYTVNPAVRWQYCDVPLCEFHGDNTKPIPTPIPSQIQCLFTKQGTAYLGTRSKTETGKDCQRWDLQTPHAHSYYTDTDFPDRTMTDASNHCRNPDDEEPGGPWCYTMDPNTRWEYCDIDMCECLTKKSGHDYGGTLSKTVTGLTCQRWDRQVPHAHGYTNPDWYPDDSISEASNYCRNPDGGWMEGLWCYTTNPNVRWERCDLPMCECLTTRAGLEYQGEISRTVSGKTCQRWDRQSPHKHGYTDASMYPDQTVNAAENYCRNPDFLEPDGPWCYTTDPATRWEYCSIPLCEYHLKPPTTPTQPSTTPFSGPTPSRGSVTELPGNPHQECKFTTAGTSYTGTTISKTTTGKVCQRWDSQSPHSHTYTDPAMYPDATISDAQNYCRNPDDREPMGPWCYTLDSNTPWEYCDVPRCDCRKNKAGTDYVGVLASTASGRTCQRWDSQSPHRHTYTDPASFPDKTITDAGNFCRNPDRDEPNGPWCYTTDPNKRWEYCDVDYCECKNDDQGLLYQGKISYTTAGKKCQRWDSQSPHQHAYLDDTMFPDGSPSAANNYCRNPDDQEPNGPWCYTTDPSTRWQYCDIPKCEYHDIRAPQFSTRSTGKQIPSTEPPTMKPPEKLTGDKGGEIAGIAIAVLVAVIILMAVSVFLMKRKGYEMKDIPAKIKEVPSKLKEIPSKIGSSMKNLSDRSFDNPMYGAEFHSDKVTLDFPQPDLQPEPDIPNTSTKSDEDSNV